MENYILNRYDKDENGNLIIKIHTKKIEDLYEDYDKMTEDLLSFLDDSALTAHFLDV